MVEPWRVAQIAVERGPDRDGSRGSGYLIAPGRVLTAAHVVAGASVVRVRLDIGRDTEVDVHAEAWWADPKGSNGTDLAVVTIAEDATTGRECKPARFGQIIDSTAVLMVQAFGFPRFKLRAGPADADQPGVFRDLEQAAGHTPVAANRRQGTLAVYLDDPPPGQPAAGEPSPWEGMSGGTVWAGGRIVAVVAEHHPSEGTGRLTARRIDRAYHQLSASDLARIAKMLELPSVASGLPEVVPAERGYLVRSAYLAQVADIAPDELLGRESEQADWAEFCAGADPYAWWQAGPWAGKSALASWFVTHPPAGVDIVSFFITGRLYGQADSGAFLDAVIEQLDALDPAGGESSTVAGARTGSWLSLLASAAAQAAERGRRLVVVVDGLDEDEAGATPSRGRPSIASLLPRRPPPGARFIVTSRPDPGVPSDVPIGHPLRTCIPRRLSVSWVAEDMASRAKQELGDLLAGDQVAVDVVGYIAGSGGGLTRGDLSALTGTPPYRLDPLLSGVFGRSLHARSSTDPRNAQADPARRVYVFAHETLRVTAEEQLGSELTRYRQRVHEWIDSYDSAGWPDTTPGYAIRGYLRLLAATTDLTRLSALARSPSRHAFLLRATGSDYAALTEIMTVQSMSAEQEVPDLNALVELAVYRHAISIRNQSVPADLPAVWARLGRFDHAEALVRAITDRKVQARALADLATTIAQTGDTARAEALARAITDRKVQPAALSAVATAAAQAGDTDRAEALARAITDPGTQAYALSDLATAAAQVGDTDRAEALARAITDPGTQERVLHDLATAAAQAGDTDRAEALARAITDPGTQARFLSDLATAAAQAGDTARVHRLATDAEALARAIIDPYAQALALSYLATAAAQAGDTARVHRLATDAEGLARTIAHPDARARALAMVAAMAEQVGDTARAHRLATDAEALARAITDPYAQAYALSDLATAAAQAGDTGRAEALARAITDPFDQARALSDLATMAGRAGDIGRAEALARAITDPFDQARALSDLATMAASRRHRPG